VPRQTLLKDLIRHHKAAGYDPFRPMLDAYLLKRDRSKRRHVVTELEMTPAPRPGGRFSPSSLCGCERYGAFKFVGWQPHSRIIDMRSALIFEDGDWRHHKWQAIFADMEAVLGRHRFRLLSIEERVAFPELYIAGSLDALIWLRPHREKPGFKILVDFKGINKRGFDYLLQTGQPKYDHVRQINSYMRAKKVRRGMLLYDCKDNQDLRIFPMRYDDEAWHDVETWVHSVLSYVRRRRVPPKHPECTPGSLMAEDCPFARICHGGMESDEIAEQAYADFVSVEDSWEKGLEGWIDE
jgi:hypothetical protein